MAIKKVVRTDNAQPFKFEKKGQKLEGYYVKSDTITIEGKPVARHLFQTASGLTGVLGQFDLGKQLAEVPPGAKVTATLLGIQKLKAGKTMKVYEVEFDDADVLDTDTMEAASLEEDDATDGEELEETDIDSEEAPEDVVPPQRASAPKQPVKTADPARKAKVAALLSGKSSA